MDDKVKDHDTKKDKQEEQKRAHEEQKDSPQAPEHKNEDMNYKEKYARALADYRNLQRQVEEERKGIFTLATAQVLLQLIPTLDMLEQAEIFVKDAGLAMVKNMFVKTLKEMGLTEVELLGKPFDPHVAEAVETVEGERDNEVVEVVKKAYALNDKIIRIGQVKVSKKPSSS